MRYNSPDDVELPDPYGVEDNCLGYYVLKKNNEHFIELCNFVPYISSQVSSYNGYETNTKVKIEGFDSKGNPLPEISVTNDEFDKLNWVRQHWGFNCNIVPGNGIRDRIRFAIQATSKYAPKTEDYSTTGWHKKDGQYIFLMPGDDANNVQLDGKLKFYEFSRRELTGKEYADIFMLIGNVAPNKIMQPLLSFAFLSPLNSFIELPVFLCSIYGFRRSEVLGLKWKSIDFHNKAITICETLQQSAGGGDYTAAPKTDSSYRTLPMTKRVEEVLLKFKAKQTENQKLMGAYYFSSDYVCTMPDGRVIAPNYIERVFHSTITKSNLPQVTLHLLRHSVASNLLNDGFSVTQVQEWLGHSSAATTLTFYAHVDKTSKLQIANQLDKIDAENGFIQLESDKKTASEKPKKIKIRPAKRTK